MRNISRSYWIGIAIFLFFFGCKPQNYTRGAQLYSQHCENCHGVDGEGLKKLYPPLKDSDYFENHMADLACIIRYGMNESIVVNGVSYDAAMPVEHKMEDTDIVNLINFMLDKWYPEYPAVGLNEVKKTLESCKRD